MPRMSGRFMSINLAKPMETVRQNPFVLCSWPSFANQPYITNYRIYDDRVGEPSPGHPCRRLVSPADAHRGLDAQVLRLCHRRLRLALDCLADPSARRCSLPRSWSALRLLPDAIDARGGAGCGPVRVSPGRDRAIVGTANGSASSTGSWRGGSGHVKEGVSQRTHGTRARCHAGVSRTRDAGFSKDLRPRRPGVSWMPELRLVPGERHV